jgi:hypothetical protein
MAEQGKAQRVGHLFCYLTLPYPLPLMTIITEGLYKYLSSNYQNIKLIIKNQGFLFKISFSFSISEKLILIDAKT